MSTSDWRPLGRVDFAQLCEVRVQAHHAVQWLARFARAYISPRSDDGHTNLGWNVCFDGLTTHSLSTGVELGLRIPDLTLLLIENGQVTQSFSLPGRTNTEVSVWLGHQMQALNLSPDALDRPLPYVLAPHPLAQGARYDATTLKEPLSELAAWYANGFSALSAVRHRLIARGLLAPEVRCWPHHFDLDCLTPIDNGSKNARTMGTGFLAWRRLLRQSHIFTSVFLRALTLRHYQACMLWVTGTHRIFSPRWPLQAVLLQHATGRLRPRRFCILRPTQIVKLSSRHAPEAGN